MDATCSSQPSPAEPDPICIPSVPRKLSYIGDKHRFCPSSSTHGTKSIDVHLAQPDCRPVLPLWTMKGLPGSHLCLPSWLSSI